MRFLYKATNGADERGPKSGLGFDLDHNRLIIPMMRLPGNRMQGEVVVQSALPQSYGRWRHQAPFLERAPVSIIHGHSSHHPKAIEICQNRLILYGCGDFLNDYEGIGAYKEFRDDLALMYFADIHPANADLIALEMVPLQIRHFQLAPASRADTDWLQSMLDRQTQKFGARIEFKPTRRLALCWTQREQPANSGSAGTTELRR